MGRIRLARWEVGYEYRSWCAPSLCSDRDSKISTLCVVWPGGASNFASPSDGVATQSQPALPHFATRRAYGQTTPITHRDVGRKVAGLLEYAGPPN